MLDLLQENYRESSGPLCPLKYGHIKSAVDPAIDENSNPVCLVA